MADQPRPVMTPGRWRKIRPRLARLRAYFRHHPDKAAGELSVRVRSLGGMRTEVKAGHHRLVLDESPGVGGTGRGMNPMEVLLGALGACQQVMIVTHAALLGVELTSVELVVTGQLDKRGYLGIEGALPGFTRMVVSGRVTARGATPERLAQLEEVASRPCPVADTLMRGLGEHPQHGAQKIDPSPKHPPTFGLGWSEKESGGKEERRKGERRENTLRMEHRVRFVLEGHTG
ncbi:MAG: OsmC family protein [Deltaproteobacteria bacterium]|nr:OsmC family protein [Deltaproteobacteria bacterium]